MRIRKHITLTKDEYQIIYDFAIKNGYSFSEILRKLALDFIKKTEQLDLLDYMNANLSPVSADERRELDALNIDFNDLSGAELSVDDVL